MINQIVKILLETSLGATILIAFLLLLRTLFRRLVSPRLIYALWLVVALRILVPISVPADFTLMRYTQPAIDKAVTAEYPKDQRIQATIPNTSTAASTTIPDNAGFASPQKPSEAEIEPESGFNISLLLFAIWSAGLLTTTTVIAVSNIQAAKVLKLCGCIPIPDDFQQIYRELCNERRCKRAPALTASKSLPSPCLLGLIRPRVVVPTEILQDKMLFSYAVRHELEHYKQRDYIWNLVRLVCLVLYWFNPLVWLGANASAQDCELSCDSMTLQGINYAPINREYGHALLTIMGLNSKRHPLTHYSVIQMANSKKSMKVRLDLIMNKPKQIIAVSLCLLLLVAAAGCGVAAASAVKTAQGNAEVSTMGKTDPKADLPIIGTQESKAPEWDIDGDGRSDNVTVSLLNEHKDNEEAKLTVVLSSQNAPIEKTYFGEWLIRDEWLTYGDINRDGKDEIVLFLMHPNFMGMPNEIHVLSFNDGDLIEINHNRVDSDVYFYGVLETGAIQSAKAITEGDQCLLRVELPWGAMSDGLTQSIDLKWNDSVWEVAKVGEAPVEPEPSDAPARTDSEYQEVYITFFLQEWEDPKGFDVVSPVVSPDNGETYPSIADRAQEALRELFVLTGYQAKDCCVLTDKVGGLMYFAYGPDDFAFSPFLWAYTDTFPYGNNPNRLTKPHGLNIFYNFVGGANKYELIDSASVILPENADAMSEEELVAWYYNRSTMKTGEILKIEHSKSDPNSKMPFYTVYTENDLTFEVHLEYDGVHRPYKLSTLSGPFDLNAEYPG